MAVDQDDAVYFYQNVGVVDITSVAPREGSTWWYQNVSAYVLAGNIDLEPWGFGHALTDVINEILPLDGDGSTYLYVNVT